MGTDGHLSRQTRQKVVCNEASVRIELVVMVDDVVGEKTGAPMLLLLSVCMFRSMHVLSTETTQGQPQQEQVCLWRNGVGAGTINDITHAQLEQKFNPKLFQELRTFQPGPSSKLALLFCLQEGSTCRNKLSFHAINASSAPRRQHQPL